MAYFTQLSIEVSGASILKPWAQAPLDEQNKGQKVDSLFSYWKFIQSRYCKADIWTVTLESWTDTSSKQTLIIIKMTKVKLTRLCWIYRKRIVLKKKHLKKEILGAIYKLYRKEEALCCKREGKQMKYMREHLTCVHVRGAAISGHLPINGWGSCSGCPRTPGCRSLLLFSVHWGSLHTGGGPGLKIALKVTPAKRTVVTHRLSGCWLPSSSCVSGTWATHGHQRGRGGRAPCTALCYKMIIKLRDAYGGKRTTEARAFVSAHLLLLLHSS